MKPALKTIALCELKLCRNRMIELLEGKRRPGERLPDTGQEPTAPPLTSSTTESICALAKLLLCRSRTAMVTSWIGRNHLSQPMGAPEGGRPEGTGNTLRNMRLIDVHAHLEELTDLPQALSEAKTEGVKGIVAVGMDLNSNARTLEIAEENPGYVYAALGYHPWEIRPDGVDEGLSFIGKHISECVALGEIGLDYKAKVKKDLQWKVFGALLDLACAHDKPVIIHCRYSHERALEMISERQIKKAVFHWYVGSLHLLERIVEKGYLISATPALRYSPFHQQAVLRAPLERILLETDTPVKYEGHEARPKDVSISLQEVARLKQLDPLVVAEQTTDNACHFFQIPHPSRLGS